MMRPETRIAQGWATAVAADLLLLSGKFGPLLQALATGFNVLENGFIAGRGCCKPVDQFRGFHEERGILFPDRVEDMRELCEQEESFRIAVDK
jgi:hypothetical protein